MITPSLIAPADAAVMPPTTAPTAVPTPGITEPIPAPAATPARTLSIVGLTEFMLSQLMLEGQPPDQEQWQTFLEAWSTLLSE